MKVTNLEKAVELNSKKKAVDDLLEVIKVKNDKNGFSIQSYTDGRSSKQYTIDQESPLYTFIIDAIEDYKKVIDEEVKNL